MVFRVTLYVLKLRKPGYYYIGTTTRPFPQRLAEHLDGGGCIWTSRYGLADDPVVEKYICKKGTASREENEVTERYMKKFGWKGVRGGDYMNCREDGSTWWLPAGFPGSSRRS